jgi:outer membrane protein assembly factor BamB
MAFDKDSGRVVWKSLQENVSYSSPIACELAGRRQVVVMTGPRVVGLDVTDGALLWSHPFQISYDESIGTPVAADDMVLFTATGKPLTAVRVERDGARFRATRAWTAFELSSYLGSMVVEDGYVYGMNDGGEFCCLRLSDGQRQWIGGSHGFYATPVLASDLMLAMNERGRLAVVRATRDAYQPVAELQLAGAAAWTAPALTQDSLFVRFERGLRCFNVADLAKR